MLRRHILLRKEYLYRKILEGKAQLLYEKKRKIREILEGKPPYIYMLIYYEISYFCYYFLHFLVLFIFVAEGKPIPTEFRNEEAALCHEIDLEDKNTTGIIF